MCIFIPLDKWALMLYTNNNLKKTNAVTGKKAEISMHRESVVGVNRRWDSVITRP